MHGVEVIKYGRTYSIGRAYTRSSGYSIWWGLMHGVEVIV